MLAHVDMSDSWPSIPYVGSFQNGRSFPSENPLEEAWQRLTRISTPGILDKLLTRHARTADADLREYIRVRTRQAHELRLAAQGASILTSPLMLYYCFLNLARAFIAVHTGQPPARGRHGLRFQNAEALFDSSAAVESGTFQEFLVATTGEGFDRTRISLGEALKSIPEMWDTQSSEIGPSRVARVKVRAFMEGKGVYLDVDVPEVAAQFASKWKELFPGLESVAEFHENTTLRISRVAPNSLREVSDFCHQYLLPDLVHRDEPIWYLLRSDDRKNFDRAAFYISAMFMLSNVVRYHPDGLSRLARDGADSVWCLERFVRKAERFFPQLVYSLVIGSTAYF